MKAAGTRSRREMYKGRKLQVKKHREWGVLATYVNGHLHGIPYGTTQAAIDRELESLRRWVDAADERRLTDPTSFEPHWYEGAPEPVDQSGEA
jgi:hypothetical protein